ncbi:sigma-70 family RNA polymerase sigma factor [Planctomycetes bacterium Poly30]
MTTQSEPMDSRQPTLVDRLRARAPGASDELIAEYRPALVRFAYGYLGDSAAAEDAAQDVLVKALGASSTPDAVRPWLYRIARNHCLNLVRNQRVRGEVALPDRPTFVDSRTGHLTRLVRMENEAELRARVESLTHDHREVLDLRYGEDLSREEIAHVLDLPPSVVKSRLYEAMKRLRDV